MVLFIDSSGEFEEGSNQNRLRDRDIDEYLQNVPRLYADVEKYARVVPLDEIEAERLESQYQPLRGYLGGRGAHRCRGGSAETPRELEQQRAAAESTMNRYLAELGFDA